MLGTPPGWWGFPLSVGIPSQCREIRATHLRLRVSKGAGWPPPYHGEVRATLQILKFPP